MVSGALLVSFGILCLLQVPASGQQCQPFAGQPPECRPFITGVVWALEQTTVAANLSATVQALTYLPPALEACQRALIEFVCLLHFPPCNSFSSEPSVFPSPVCSSRCTASAAACPASISGPLNCSAFPSGTSTVVSPVTGASYQVPCAAAPALLNGTVLPCRFPYVQASPTSCQLQCPSSSFDPWVNVEVSRTIGKVFGIFEIIFLSVALVLGLLEARMAMFSGDNQKGYPLFFIIAVLMFVLLLFASRWTDSFVCDNPWTASTGTSNRLCAWSGWWVPFFHTAGSFWFMMMGLTLFGHVYQVRAINNLPTWALAGIHVFCWGFCCIMATLGVTVAGVSPSGTLCGIDQLANNGWWQDGLQIVPVGVFGGTGMVFFAASMVRVVLVLGINSIWKHLRLTVMVATYMWVLGYYLAVEIYFRVALPPFRDGFVSWLTCIANGGTADTCPKNGFLNFPSFIVNEVNLLILCLAIFLLYALTGAPGRFLGLVKRTATGFTSGKETSQASLREDSRS